jgi:hypothetical protein
LSQSVSKGIPVARKPSDVVQLKIRLREHQRRRLEREAKRRGVSLSYEMTSRIERSFEQENVRGIDVIRADMETAWARYGDAMHRLNMQGDLVQAVETLLARLDETQPGAAEVRQVLDAIKIQAGAEATRLHTN